MQIRFDRGTLVREAERDREEPDAVAGVARDANLHASRLATRLGARISVAQGAVS
jgi:hypothetical protein